MRREKVSLVEETGADYVELPGKIVEVVRVVLEVPGFELAERVVYLKLDVLGQVEPVSGRKGLVKFCRAGRQDS